MDVEVEVANTCEVVAVLCVSASVEKLDVANEDVVARVRSSPRAKSSMPFSNGKLISVGSAPTG